MREKAVDAPAHVGLCVWNRVLLPCTCGCFLWDTPSWSRLLVDSGNACSSWQSRPSFV